MSTLELEHIKHSSSSGNNLSVHSNGSLTVPTLQCTTLNAVDVTNHVRSDRIRVHTASSNPSSPGQGDMYYDTSAASLKVYTGTAWVNFSPDIEAFSNIVSTNMAHHSINTQQAGSTRITNHGAAAISVTTTPTTNSDFGLHGGHAGSSVFPQYHGIYLGSNNAKAVNRMDFLVHGNCFGYFELQGSNNAGTSGAFVNTGNWTSLAFTTSNNSQNNQNCGGQSSGLTEFSTLTFQYTNNTTYTHYRIWIKDISQPAESLGTRYGGYAAYQWRLYRV